MRMQLKTLIPALAALLLIFSACSEPEQPLTRSEAIAFAGELEKSIAKGAPEFLDNAFDKKEFAKRMQLPDTKDGNGYASGVMEKLQLGSQLTASLTDRDNFNFIKHYEKEGRHHVLFRIYTDKDGSLNYQDFELTKAGGKCSIADVYIYMSGETMAETLSSLYATMYQHTAGTSQRSFSDADVADINEFKNAKQLLMKGQYKEARESFDRLPEYLRKTKAASLIYVRICSGLGNEEYGKAIDLYRQRFPGERNINMLMIDGYFIQKDYAKVIEVVNALDSQLNKDPLLDYYRYLSYNLLKDDANANKCLLRLVAAMPDFEKGALELIAVKMEQKDKKATDSLVAIYRKKAKFDQQALERVISYYQ